MATSKETIDKDQPGDASLDVRQTKIPKTILKRKIMPDAVSPVKQCRMVEERVVSPSACSFCNKKLKFISAFMCRCEKFFCNKHRFCDQHDCSFDFKTEARNRLKANNPKIVARKLGE